MNEVEITAEGFHHLNELPAEVRSDALANIFDYIADDPHCCATPLVSDLEGLCSVNNGDYRVIYEIFEDDRVVLIHRVHRNR